MKQEFKAASDAYALALEAANEAERIALNAAAEFDMWTAINHTIDASAEAELDALTERAALLRLEARALAP